MTTHYASTTKHGAKLTIYYDTSDPQNPGWAWRVLGYDDNESGPLDDLDDLLAVVQGHAPDDLDGLPTFGGTEPDDTTEVWSWDENWLLVGTCAADLEIVARPVRSDIDHADIRALRSEAAEASDYDMVAICDRALEGDALAWGECCEVIEDARAQIDG